MMDADLDEIRTTRGHPGRAIIAHLAREDRAVRAWSLDVISDSYLIAGNPGDR